MKYRSRLDIIWIIVKIVSQQQSNQTRVMYGARLSVTQVHQYLKFCLDKGLLRMDLMNYIITDKGLRLLKLLEEVETLVDFWKEHPTEIQPIEEKKHRW